MKRLQEIVEQIEQQPQPPVHLWVPELVGEIDIKIDVDGNWFHEGEPISREKLVRLFASILWFENQQHYLVTPAEKLAIEVADSPYIIHQAEYVDGAWLVTTNTHEQLVIGIEHPVELRDFIGQWVPYVNVRYDLWARVNRSIYVQWVTDALENQGSSAEEQGAPVTLSSQGYAFAVAK